MNVLNKASDVQNFVKKENLKALSGKNHKEALIEIWRTKLLMLRSRWTKTITSRISFGTATYSGIHTPISQGCCCCFCTYWTNAYGLPFLHVVGFTCTNQTFTAAVGFTDGEAFTDYVWIINEIDVIFLQDPNILVVDCDIGLMKAINEKWPRAFSIICWFHIANNIITRCRILFSNAGVNSCIDFMDNWNAIVHAPTEGLFMQRWQQLPTTAVSFYIART